MTKTVIIGIGGTGLRGIREIRRLIAERYDQGLKAPEVSSVKFLYIDTDDGDSTKLSWSVLGKDIRLTPGEKVIITGNNLGPLVQNPANYGNLDQWLPSIKNYVGQPGDGAKGIRPYGRLIYEYQENNTAIQTECINCCNLLSKAFPAEINQRFYLIAGLSGGTGSGMFLPLSLDLQKWNLYQKGTNSQKFYAFLVLPPLAIAGRHDRYHANAFAALKELNYYACNPDPQHQNPYDNCYLLEPRRDDGATINLDTLPLLIAQRIFLNIQGGTAAVQASSIMDNPSLGNLESDLMNNRHSLSFSTFGISTVSYPREIIAQCLAYKFAETVALNWISEKEYPKDINARVKQELDSMRLSLSHIDGDRDPFGNEDFKDYKTEILDRINEEVAKVQRRQLGENADVILLKIQEEFRGQGIAGFYQQRENDVEGAVDEALKQTRLKITNFLLDPGLGLGFAKKFLGQLILILGDEFKKDVNSRIQDKNVAKRQRSRNNLHEIVQRIRKNESKLLYRGFEDDRNSLITQLERYLGDVASFNSAKYGSAFLEKIIPQVREMRNNLDEWEKQVGNLKDSLAGLLETILQDLEQGIQENGKALFSKNSLEKIISQANLASVQSVIENKLKTKLGQQNLDLITLNQYDKLRKFVYDLAYEAAIESSLVDLEQFTLYDKFVDEYPDTNKRQEILKDVKSLSSCFLKFSPQQIALGQNPIIPTQAIVTVIPPGTGLINQDGRPNQSIITDDLTAVGVDQTYTGNDPECITFLREKQSFPLRFIESLSTQNGLKESYENYPYKEALHIDKSIFPYLYDLYLLTQIQRQDLIKAENVFVFSRAYNWIKREKNTHNNRWEIRYETQGRLGIDTYRLGKEWDEVFPNFVKDSVLINPENQDIRNARPQLQNKAHDVYTDWQQNLQTLDDITAKLQQFLQTCEQQYQGGRNHPNYQKYQTIANRILTYFDQGVQDEPF
jgi:Tubulin like